MAAPTITDLERFAGRDLDTHDIAAVIVTAAARTMANPEGTITETVGSVGGTESPRCMGPPMGPRSVST